LWAKPAYQAVSGFAVSIGILKNYQDSGHGKALRSSGSGPNCVTCHGAHAVQKASLDIINEERCSQCHSYERAAIMKLVLSSTEKKISDIDKDLKQLAEQAIYTEDEGKTLYRTHAIRTFTPWMFL
jgi:hypothetical protein